MDPGFVIAISAAGTTVAVAEARAALAMAINNTPDPNIEPADPDGPGGQGLGDPADDFRGSGYSQDEISQFVYQHTGEGNPAMGRPALEEIDKALTKGTPQRLPGQNAEKFEYGGVRVIVNYDMPWRSTAYYPGS
ncbi:hypothetical protein [Saccharopolyspora pogona]|uniref:hypothetical protein n=1 Tax=Saccharopolyspora pogona TaxID=333966 RepID=UPI0016898643|nr:hypothetical protein [Saccharopolyspora pogona]